jgi:hypothetical protein
MLWISRCERRGTKAAASKNQQREHNITSYEHQLLSTIDTTIEVA